MTTLVGKKGLSSKELTDLMNGKGKEKVFKEVVIERTGNKIILPEGMTYKQGRDWLTRQEQSEEKMVNYSARMKAYPTDGAYAFYRAVNEIFGYADLVNTEGPSQDEPPTTIEVKLPDGKTINVPWGRLQIPGMDKECFLETSFDRERMEFIISGNIRKKHELHVNMVVDATREILKSDSLYKGRAIKLDLAFMLDQKKSVNEPEFMDTSRIREEDILLSDLTKSEYSPVMLRITRTQECLDQGIRLKHGALLSGPFGTGKTLLATYTAKVAVENGWTFIYLKDVQHLQYALRIAELYGKVVLFAEDVDKAVEGERTDEMNRILNTLDGVDTKKYPIITVLTTNHLENINKSFLRAGRIDSLIVMGGLQEDNALQFINRFTVNAKGESLLDPNGNYAAAAKAMVGIVPAFASEVIAKAKTNAMARGGSKEHVTSNDLELATESFRRHMALTETSKRYSNEEKLAYSIVLAKELREDLCVPADFLKEQN